MTASETAGLPPLISGHGSIRMTEKATREEVHDTFLWTIYLLLTWGMLRLSWLLLTLGPGLRVSPGAILFGFLWGRP
jgi:hypothetical protein